MEIGFRQRLGRISRAEMFALRTVKGKHRAPPYIDSLRSKGWTNRLVFVYVAPMEK